MYKGMDLLGGLGGVPFFLIKKKLQTMYSNLNNTANT